VDVLAVAVAARNRWGQSATDERDKRSAADAGRIVARVPDDNGDDSHREICPSDNPDSQLRQEAYRLRDAAKWIGDDEAPRT